VAIQLQASGRGPYTTLRTLNATGYFDVRLSFARGGNLRLAYRYPATDPFLPVGFTGTTAYSRIVKLKVS
jgi:hypothetical protein